MKARIFKYFLFFAVLATSASVLGAEYVLSFVYTQVGSEDTKYNICGYFDKDKIILDSDFGWNKGKDDVCNRNNGGEIDDYMMCKNAANACSRANYSFNTNTITLTLDTKCKDHGTYTGPTVTIDGKSKSFGSITYDSDYEQKTVVVELTGVSAGNHDVSVAFAGSDKFYVKTLTITQTSAPATTYALTLSNDGNGTAASDQKNDAAIPENTSVTITATPKEGYKFVNWTGSSTETDNPFMFSMTEAKSYQANFAVAPKISITVVSEDNDKGDVTGSGSFYEGSQQTITATPKDGYLFSQWDDGNTNATRQITVSSSKTTYTASFIESSCPTGTQVVFGDPSGGWGSSFDKATQTVTFDNGWQAISWELNVSKSTYQSVYIKLKENIESTAKKIIVYKDQGCGTEIKQQTEGDEIEITLTGDLNYLGFKAENACSITFECVTLRPYTYTITYNPGANGEGTIPSGTKSKGVNFTLSSSKFTRTGYDQTGWATSDGGAKVYELGGTYSTDANTTLYPVWTPNVYNITYHLNEGAWNGTAGAATYTYGTGIATLATNVQRDGYTFVGWYNNDGLTGDAVTSIAANAIGNKDLYAKWQKDKSEFTITYLPGANGSGSIDAGTKQKNVDFTLSSSTFTREHYTQTGWSTTDGGAKAYDLGGTYTTNADITLYPFWTPNQHTLTWVTDGDALTGDYTKGSVAYGTTIVEPNTPTKSGFAFVAWTPEVPATMPDNDVTLTATWKVDYCKPYIQLDCKDYDASKVTVHYDADSKATITAYETYAKIISGRAIYLPVALEAGTYNIKVSGRNDGGDVWLNYFTETGSSSNVTYDGAYYSKSGYNNAGQFGDTFEEKSWDGITVSGGNYLFSITGHTDAEYQWIRIYKASGDPFCPTMYEVNFTQPDHGSTSAKVVANEHTLTSGEEVPEGSKVIFTWAEATGYEFVKFSDGENNYTENPCTLTVNSDLTITTTIDVEVTKHELTATVADGQTDWGSVSPASQQVGEGHEANITATPNKHYRFVGWTATGITLTAEQETDATLTIEMPTTDVALVAHFMYVSVDNMIVTGNSTTCDPTSHGDATMTATSVADVNGFFSHNVLAFTYSGMNGSGDYKGVQVTRDGAYDKDLSEDATGFGFFYKTAAGQTITFCFDYGDGGDQKKTELPSTDGLWKYAYVASMAADGWDNGSITIYVNGKGGASGTWTPDSLNVSGATTTPNAGTFYLSEICATEIQSKPEEVITYDLIVTTDGNGTTSTVPAVTTDLKPGTSVTLTATPNDDYRFKNWTIGGSVVATMNPYTLTVDSTTTIQANFEYYWTYYDITLGSSLNGSVAITVDGEPHDGKNILVGTDVVLTATPNSDAYAFQQWQDGNTDNPRTIQVNAETAAEIWTATFTPTYLVTATVDEFGKEVIGSGVKYGGGNSVTLTAVSNVEGYQLKEWVDVTGIILTEEQRTSNPLVFTMQYQEVSLKATFMPVECTDTLIIQCEDLSNWITETDEKMTKTPVPRPNSGMCGNYSNYFLDYHGSGYFDIKSAALDHAVQKYYKLTLPAGTFSFTIWTAADDEAQDCRMYIYTQTDGEGEVTYDGVNYSQAGWAQVDHVEPAPAHFGIGGVISNITLPSKQTVFVALYVGAGGRSAAFDQIKIQADSTVFCTEIITDVWSVYGNFDGEWKDYVLTDGVTTIPNLEKDSSYPFKLHKASYGDKHEYYGATSPTNSYEVSGATWIMDGVFDVNLSTEARGDYLFRATNLTETYPQITITYPVSYTIAFNDNGADGGEVMEYIIHLAAGDTAFLPLMTRTKTGYRFAGWKDESDNTYADGDTISNITDNIVLTAQWEKRVTGLIITQAQGQSEVVAGEQLQLSVEYTPSDATYGKSVIWTSSNTTYLTVDENGLVTGVIVGSGNYITATNPDGVSNTYYINVTSIACENVWQVHMWNTDNGTNASHCMHQIDGTTEWQTGQVVLPSASNAEQLKVLYNGADQTYTKQWNTNWVPFVGHQYEDAPAATQFYPMENSVGYFRIYTDNTTENYFLAFQPTYRITMGEDGQDWQAYDFAQIANGHEYETERIQVPDNYKSMNYYVGTKHSNGTTTIYVSKDGTDKSKTQALSGINGLSGEDRAGQYGTYHIYDNSKDYNWYCEFRLYYMYRMLNEDGSSFYLSDGVFSGASDKSTTLYAPTPSKIGYDFAQWQRKNTSVYFDAGGAYTYCMAMDTLLPVFTPKQYTITLNRNRGESDGQATATYRSNTLSELTHVGDRESYTLLGYYISTASDVKVINVDGTLVAGVEDYTDAEGNWIKDGDCTLYAQWQSNLCTSYLQLDCTDYDASKVSIHYDADGKASITKRDTYVTLNNNGAIYLPVALEAGVYNIQLSGRNDGADTYLNFFTGVETSCNITCDGRYYSKTAYHNMGTFGSDFEESSWENIVVAGGTYLFGIAGHADAEYQWIRIYKADSALFCPEEPEDELLLSLTSDSHFESLTGAGYYTVGATVTAYATASEDYAFLNWTSEDGLVLSTENPYTFVMPSTNLTIKANAQEDVAIKHLVTTTMGAPGLEVLGGNRNYSFGSEVSLLAVSGRADYKLKKWMEISGINLSDVQRTANPLKFTMPYSDVTLKAIFAPMECSNTLFVQCEDQSYWIDETKITKTPVPMPQSSQCGSYNDHYEGYHGGGYFDMKEAAYNQSVQKYYKMILPAGTFAFTFWTAADDLPKDSRAYIYTQTDGDGEVTYDGVNYRQVGFAQIDHVESNPARFGVGGAICNITIPAQQIVLVALYAGKGGLSASFDQIKVTTTKDVFCYEISTDTCVIYAGEEKEIPVCGVEHLIIYEGGVATNTEDVEVYTSAQYKRMVTIDKWETFALPYTANVIYVHDTDDGRDYQIWPTYILNGTNKAGYFYMEQLKDTLVTITGDDFRQRWMTTTTFMPQVDSAYIIKYPTAQSDGYFAEKEITYKLSKDGCILRGANTATKFEDTDVYEGATRFFYYPNNSVVNIQLETSAYILNEEGTYFEVQERPVIPPFHCYIQTTEEMKRSYPRLTMYGGGKIPTLVPCPREDIFNAAVKIIDHQQLIIIRNGIKYNAQGALIK